MKYVTSLLLTIVISCFAPISLAGPEEDRAAFAKYFSTKFPKTETGDFINGVYSIHPQSRAQWEEIEEFPPYEIAIEEGEELFNTSFANGKGYGDCFANEGKNVRSNYPHFDVERGEVITLELAINECRVANNEKPLKYKKGAIANLSAYLAYLSRGQKMDIKIPNDAALQAYESGKEFYYSKRGQLNFSCMDCHGVSAGKKIRADILSPAIGHASHFPVYRSKWGGMGTLHRRFDGCNKQVRAKPLAAQGEEYRNLEYFLSYMSNQLEFNGPGARK